MSEENKDDKTTQKKQKKYSSKSWPHGKIHVEFENDTIMFTTGQVIRGKVIVDQKQDFQGTDVVIGLNGSELTNFRRVNSDRDNMYASKFVFINASHTIKTFEEPLSPAGTHEFPFEFRTPEWLPTSSIYNAEFQSSNFKIRYGIWAQIRPLNVNDYVDSKKTISIFRASKEIFLFRPKI